MLLSPLKSSLKGRDFFGLWPPNIDHSINNIDRFKSKIKTTDFEKEHKVFQETWIATINIPILDVTKAFHCVYQR